MQFVDNGSASRQITEWVEVEVLMKHLHIKSRQTLSRYIKDGLPCHRAAGRKLLFDLLEVDLWLRNRCSAVSPGGEQTGSAA